MLLNELVFKYIKYSRYSGHGLRLLHTGDHGLFSTHGDSLGTSE